MGTGRRMVMLLVIRWEMLWEAEVLKDLYGEKDESDLAKTKSS